jgi:hypothetical protein
MNEAELAHARVETLENSLRRSHRGVDRFNKMLESIGFQMQTEERLRDTLHEMYYMRNTQAHGKGNADQRLVKGCPWLQLSPGDPVVITSEQYQRYMDATVSYTRVLVNKVGHHYGEQV